MTTGFLGFWLLIGVSDKRQFFEGLVPELWAELEYTGSGGCGLGVEVWGVRIIIGC